MRYVVYGAGGIGAALGAFLWESGRDATIIARGEHLERIRERGLTLVTPEGARQVAVPAAGHPSELAWHGAERVLLTMKAQDTEEALRDLRAAGADTETTAIFCVQNCIANERIAARYFARVYGVMIVIPGIYLEPGVVHNPITGNHGFMDIGRYPHGVDDEAAAMVETIRAAGYAAQLHENVMAAKGSKFLGNLGNAFGAITDGRGDGGPFMARVRQEAERCLRAASLPFEEEKSYRERCHTNRGKNAPTEGLEGVTNRGSSWQSLKRGQGSVETDFLNGEVVLLGRLNGIHTPCNRILQRVANEMARLRQPPGLYTAEELTEMADALPDESQT